MKLCEIQLIIFVSILNAGNVLLNVCDFSVRPSANLCCAICYLTLRGRCLVLHLYFACSCVMDWICMEGNLDLLYVWPLVSTQSIIVCSVLMHCVCNSGTSVFLRSHWTHCPYDITIPLWRAICKLIWAECYSVLEWIPSTYSFVLCNSLCCNSVPAFEDLSESNVVYNELHYSFNDTEQLLNGMADYMASVVAAPNFKIQIPSCFHCIDTLGTTDWNIQEKSIPEYVCSDGWTLRGSM